VNTFGTGKIEDEKLEKYILEKFDMRPKALIDELKLLRPIYLPTAGYGHFGRKDFPWESTARAAKMADDLAPKAAKANGSNGSSKKGKAQAHASA
jgi:S-adenosylmethionine synthetase